MRTCHLITSQKIHICSSVSSSSLCRYGHVHKMAQSELKGINSVEGVEGILYQVSFLPWYSIKHVEHLHVLQQKLDLKYPSRSVTTLCAHLAEVRGPSHRPAESLHEGPSVLQVEARFSKSIFANLHAGPRPHIPIINPETCHCRGLT